MSKSSCGRAVIAVVRRVLLVGVCLGLGDTARADVIVSISGDHMIHHVMGTGTGRAVQWSSSVAFEDVAITAQLGTPMVGGPDVDVTAYLTTRIGPGTTAADDAYALQWAAVGAGALLPDSGHASVEPVRLELDRPLGHRH
jgi:hypothetical protein